jgi:hypothetical protein
MLAGILNCKIGELFECSFTICGKLTAAQSAVPDRTSTFPSISSNLSSGKEESAIWDARVEGMEMKKRMFDFLDIRPTKPLNKALKTTHEGLQPTK